MCSSDLVPAPRAAGDPADPLAIPLPRWEKKGRIFCREGGLFFKSHAMRPIPHLLGDGRLRLFLSSRCAEDMMHPTYVDVDRHDPSKVLDVAEEPLMPIGRAGTFDDSGITMASIVRHAGRTLVYYTGWKRRRVVKIGRAHV